MTIQRQKLVVVLGMHRSGTSAISGLLSHLGANFGRNLIPSAPDNKKGFFENADLVALNNEILAEFGLSWSSCRNIHWTPSTLAQLNLKFGHRASALVNSITSAYSGTSAIKDPRLSRLLPFWHGVFLACDVDVSFLWVLRNPAAVAQSLANRNCYNPETSCALWLRYNLDILEFKPQATVTLVEFNDVLRNERAIARQFASDYDLKTPAKDSRNYLDITMTSDKDALEDRAFATLTASSELYSYALDLYHSLQQNLDQTIDTNAYESHVDGKAVALDHFSAIVDTTLAREKSWLADQAEAFQRESTVLQQENGALKENYRILQQENSIVQEENINLKEENRLLIQENARLNAQVTDIFSSRSWKLTRIYSYFGEKAYRLIKIPIYIKVYIHSFFTRTLYRISGFATSRGNRATIQELTQGRGLALSNALNKLQTRQQLLPDLDIVLVTHNSSKWLEGFFTSLCNQRYPLSRISLSIVDNSSQDNTYSLLQQHTGAVASLFRSINIEKRPNEGFGAGAHCAIQQGTANFVLVTNVDLEFNEDSLFEVVTQATRDPEHVASWELRQQPHEHPKYYDPITLKTSWSSHACVLMRREAYTRVGGYEKRIFMYGEDVELSYRFRREGYHLKYVPSAAVNHYSYDEAFSFKPVQFYGSTLANAYIRLRYGNLRDILGLFGLYTLLFLDGGPPQVSRFLILKNFGKVIINAPYFLSSRKRSLKDIHFPFRKWDYEMVREGAFYTPPAKAHAMPKVSIVTRTYQGREKWLNEAISSVLNQTYKNIELIIVEDGGESQRELAEQCKVLFTGARSIIYSAQPKRGRSYNGNAGLAAASGDFIMFLDDDDLLFCDHVETLANELVANEHIAASYALSWEVATEYVQEKESIYIERMYSTPGLLRQEFDREVLKTHNYIPIQSILFRRTLFERYGGFDVDMYQLEDWDLWFRYSSESVFKYVPKTTSLYRTPYNAAERASRHQLLHENYDYAKGKQAAFLQSLTTVESHVEKASLEV
ncbi:MAG: glycosyltransferase [Halioglobus sp.]